MPVVRKAKIIATVGPSNQSVEVLRALIKAGANCFRLNMSHGDENYHKQSIQNIREAAKSEGIEVAILCDLQGPKIRVDKIQTPLQLVNEQLWIISAEENLKNLSSKEITSKWQAYAKKHCPEFSAPEVIQNIHGVIPTVYQDLVSDMRAQTPVLFDDGLIQAECLAKTEMAHNPIEKMALIKITNGGELKASKGINLPLCEVTAPSFTEKDKENLLFGLKHGIDYVALSFVRRAEDIKEAKALLHRLKVQVPVIAKIERPDAINRISEIIDVTDMIMVARGDMGVELGNHLVPSVQKMIIEECNKKGVPVITATQMLESMIHNPSPTRAEASDVANAIWDGTDIVMLSGETASGSFPVKAVEMMDKIVREAEKTPKERPLMRNTDLSSVNDSTMVAASLIAEKIGAKFIVSVTQSGNSCRRMTRFRPSTPVIGVAPTVEVARRLALLWGILPFVCSELISTNSGENTTEEIEFSLIEELREKFKLEVGDKIVITRGDGKFFERGRSNSIRVEILKAEKKKSQGLNLSKSRPNSNVQIENFRRGKILLDRDVCASCQNCVTICPHDIWQVTNNKQKETFIDITKIEKCTVDMECVRVCPSGAIEIISTDFE